MIDFFFNYLAVPLIFAVVLYWIAGWIYVIYKADRFVHKQFEPPPYVPTPEEKAASLTRVLKMAETMGLSPEDKAAGLARVLKMMKAEQTPAHHH